MNLTMQTKLGLQPSEVIGCQFENLLTIGSKIFYQTHFYPLIKMQNSANEIYLIFKGTDRRIPVLLNVEINRSGSSVELICSAMEITNRNRYEKELIDAKKSAEKALSENVGLKKAKDDLVLNKQLLESQLRNLKSLKEQQQEIFKLIAHDFQEPLRKTVFYSNYILNKNVGLPTTVVNQLEKIKTFTSKMRSMLLTLLRFKELEELELEYSSIDLNEIIEQATIDLDLHNDKSVVISYPKSYPQFYADKKMITRLFTELLINSQNDQNPDNSKLNIEISAIETIKNSFFVVTDTYKYDKFVKITYTYNGLGFNSKIFEIVNISVELNKVNLGLAYCKEIVEKHSGSIKAKSVPGEGLYYTILLPIHKPTKPLLH